MGQIVQVFFLAITKKKITQTISFQRITNSRFKGLRNKFVAKN